MEGVVRWAQLIDRFFVFGRRQVFLKKRQRDRKVLRAGDSGSKKNKHKQLTCAPRYHKRRMVDANVGVDGDVAAKEEGEDDDDERLGVVTDRGGVAAWRAAT
jgi:hypothetical protein